MVHLPRWRIFCLVRAVTTCSAILALLQPRFSIHLRWEQPSLKMKLKNTPPYLIGRF